jgi:alpha-glucosidase
LDLRVLPTDRGFDLEFAGRTLLRHESGCPAVAIARGTASVTMVRGNFRIEDGPVDALEPADFRIDGSQIELFWEARPCVRITLASSAIKVETLLPGFDRITVRFYACADETVWGGGEQMSYLALNGRRFPMWTSEPGVGRDKTTALTRMMDEAGMAGGDYWTTNYPQPTFLTSRWLAVHLDAAVYSVLDFTDPDRHSVEVWSAVARFEIFAAADPAVLVGNLSSRFGRPPMLPDWACGGAIVGLKDGERSFERLDRFIDAGTVVAGLWCEDWAGIRQTSFGRRLFWDWRMSAARYPDLPARIAALRERGIRFLAYANPYLAIDGTLFATARNGGHLALRQDSDEPYLVDFGEFDCGVLDFTREETRDWFAETILGQAILDIGIDGWMADFGEYLPTDVRLADGSDPMEAHNRWPVLWAEVNAQALASRGKSGEALFFMRAGFSGVQSYCPLLWAGDQSVDFTRHDGIGTVITAALSAGLLGNAYSHSDCGGYTSLLGNVRSEALMMRWCELAAFAPVMRSHEGNRPDDNLQYDSTPELLACFARWSRVHAHLKPYVRHLCAEAAASGLPAQRPLFLHYPEARALRSLQDQYLYGSDMLVAPVVEDGAVERLVVLPGETRWRHVWMDQVFDPGVWTVPAPMGQPPVFYREDSPFSDLFRTLKEALAG